MTGLHAFHVISGLVNIAIVYGRVRRNDPTTSDAWPVEASVKYWHFVDVVWIFFYPALYLIG
jgi:cytochrome c oxidase subunit 3